MRREVFLIFKEAVNNIARHSRCTLVKITLYAEGRELTLQISDNGQGFDPNSASDRQGLAGMRQRAKKLSGEVVVISNCEAGTNLTLRLPLTRTRRTERKL